MERKVLTMLARDTIWACFAFCLSSFVRTFPHSFPWPLVAAPCLCRGNVFQANGRVSQLKIPTRFLAL